MAKKAEKVEEIESKETPKQKKTLIETMLSTGSLEFALLKDSYTYNMQNELIDTDIPIINTAFSGKIDGGFGCGITMFGAPSKHFKSKLALLLVKAYFKKYSDAICVFYNSEFGITKNYIESDEIDPSRVIEIPTSTVEKLKVDIYQKLNELKRGNHVIFLIDSLGNLASKKEADDALAGKDTADMTRAKAIKSFFRLVTADLTILNLPLIIVNHTYETLEFISQTKVGGGTGAEYNPTYTFTISKRQEKSADELVGFQFTLNIYKSRYVKEKSKFPFHVYYEEGIDKYSGMLELAEEAGIVEKITKPLMKSKKTVYHKIGVDTELTEDMMNEEFWVPILKDENFKKFVEKKYLL